MKYQLHHPPASPSACGDFATLALALEASGVPPSCWSASLASHPDEICTFYASPGIVPGTGPQWTITAPGVAAEFCATERAAGRLPSPGRQAS
jgi:hypothetical protein